MSFEAKTTDKGVEVWSGKSLICEFRRLDNTVRFDDNHDNWLSLTELQRISDLISWLAREGRDTEECKQ